jgi:hypothetical protein
MPQISRCLSVLSVEREPFVICAHCFQRIGLYEPTVAIDQGQTRRRSLTAEPGLQDGDLVLLHKNCVDDYAATRPFLD